MKHIKTYFACLLMAVLSIGQVWATDATMTAGTNGSACTVNSKDGIKVGTSKAGGNMSITVGAGATKLTFYAAAWKGVTGLSLNVSGITADAIALTADDGISNNSPFTLSGTESNFKKEITLSNITEETTITFTSSTTKRFVVWGATYETSTGGGDVIVKTLKSIAVTGQTTSYETGDAFSFDGTCTATYSVTKNDVAQEDEEKTVTPTSVSSPDMTTAGEKEVTVSFTDGDVTKSTSYNINVVAATKSSLIFTEACGGSGTADDDVAWTVASDADESNFDSNRGIHYGTGSKAVEYIELTSAAFSEKITKIKVEAAGANTPSISVTVGGTTFGETVTGLTNSNVKYTIEPTNEQSSIDYTGAVVVRIAKSSSANGALYVKSVVVYYVSDGKEAAGLAYDAADAQKLAKLGVAFTAPTLSTADGFNGTVTYASNNTDVAEVAANGAVTIKAVGVAEITASFAGNDDFKAGSASYTIGVTTHAGTSADPYSVADAKIVIDAVGTKENAYVAGKICTIQTTTLPEDGFITFFISADGTTTGQQIEAFKCKSFNGGAFTALSDVTTGASVVIAGSLKKYNSTYELDQDCYLVSYEAPTVPKQSIANDQATAYTVAQALVYAADGVTYDLDDEVYVRGKVAVASTGLFSNKYLTYSISDDGTTTSVLKVYNGLGINGAAFEGKDDILVGEVVIVKGKLTQHNTELEFAANNELVWKKPAATVAIENMELEFAEEATISATITPAAATSTVVYSIKTGSDDVITLVGDKVTAKSATGTATVVATIAATDDYEGTTKEFTITVVEPAAPAEPATLPFVFNGGRNDIENTQGMSQDGLGSDYNNSPKLKFDGTGDVVIINFASAPGKLTFEITGNSFSDGTFSVQESEDGVTYTDVVAYTELGAKSSKEETLAQASRFVKFIYTEKVSGNVALGNIAIAEYVAPAAVVTPTFTLEEGTYIGEQSVTITCATDGATIYYTQGENPADPTSASTEYKGAFAVSSTTTIKAIAIKGSDASNVVSATYTIVNLEHAGTVADPYTVADARTAIDAGVGVTGVYVTGIVSEIVEAYNSTYGNISYNISADGETTSDQLQAFRGKNKDGEWFTSENDVQVGDEVVVYGNLKKYGETYEFDKDNQRYSFTRAGAPVLQSIAISGTPSKTTYDVGDVFEVTGLVVTGTYDKGDPTAITTGITWEVRTNSTSEAVALASYTLAKDQTALQVRATVSDIASTWYDVTGLTVKEHEITPGKYEILLNNALWGSELTGSLSGENLKDYSGSKNDISFAYNKGTGSNMYFNATQTRLYNGNELVVTAPTGYVIEKVEGLVATVQANAGTITDNVWTGNVNSVTFSHKNSTGNSQLGTISVTFAEYVPAAVATPTFSPAAGTFTSAQNVTITCETDGATIYYTTDGNDPDNTSTPYTSTITVDESMTIKAIAYKEAEHSEVATAVYTINIEVVETPVATDSKWVPATEIVDGIQVLITGVKSNVTYAMSASSSNGNNRTSAAGTLSEGVFTPGDNTMPFTLIATGAENTYYIKTSNNQYLYNASTSGNSYLKTKAAQENVSWTITLDTDGNAVITSVENTNRTLMRLNPNGNSNPLFNCYASGQNAIKLYVPQSVTPTKYDVTITSPIENGTVEADKDEVEEGETVTLTVTPDAGYELAELLVNNSDVTSSVSNGSYSFEMPAENVTVNATFSQIPTPPTPDYETVRTGLIAGYYYTMCLDKAVTAVLGGSIWRVLSKEDKNVNPGIILEEVIGTLDAGRPYFFYATAATLEVVYTGNAVGAPVNDEANNGLVGSFAEAPIAQSDDNFILYNNMLYFVNSNNVKVGAHRAYLDMNGVPAYSNSTPAPGRRRVTMQTNGEQVATGMDEVNVSETAVKMMIDGQLFILRGEKMYDATGRLVK